MIRTFAASASIFALMLTAPVPAAAEEAVGWQVASGYPATLAVIGQTPRTVADRLRLISDGEVDLEIFEPGALVGVLETFDSVAAGAIEAGYTAGTFWSGKDVAFNMYSSVPFGPGNDEYIAWMMHGGGKELQDELYADYGLKSLPCGLVAPEAAGWFNKEINSVDDLAGLTIRFAGLGSQVIARVGASTQLVAPGDIYTALDRGTIDAAEFSHPAADLSLGLHEVAQYYYFPGWQQQAAIAQLLVNLDAWEALSERQQVMIEMACNEALVSSLAEGEAIQADAIAEIREHGVEIRELPDDVVAALEEAWQEVAEELSEQSETFRRAWESYSAFREDYAEWRRLNSL